MTLTERGWARAPPEGLARVHSLIGHAEDPIVWTKKYGRKSVFLREAGFYKIYVIADDGRLHMDRCVSDFTLETSVQRLLDLAYADRRE